MRPEQWHSARPLECYKKKVFANGASATLSVPGISQHWHEHSRFHDWSLAPSKSELAAQTRWTDTVETPIGSVNFKNTTMDSQNSSGITSQVIQNLINSDLCISTNLHNRQHYTAA